MPGDDITIEILKTIRDEARETRRAFTERFDAVDQRFDVLEERVHLTSQRLDITNERLGLVESTLLTLARRQRSMGKVLKASMDAAGAAVAGVSRLDTRVTNLEERVGRLENR